MVPRVLAVAISLMLATEAIADQRPPTASRPARATTGVDPAVEITAIADHPPAAWVSPIRLSGETTFDGYVFRGRPSDFVALVGARNGTWHIFAGTVLLGGIRRTALDAVSVPWRIRTPALGLAAAGGFDQIKAILSRSMLPVGRVVDSSVWRTVLAESAVVRVSSGPIPAHWLRVASVGSRAADPNTLIPVSGQEPVTVASIGATPGTCLQLLLQPLDNSRVWPMPTCGLSQGSRWSDILYIGKSGYPAAEALELFTKFAATAIATTKPLPVSPIGLSPAEFAEYAPFIRAISTRVTLVRAITACDVQVAITRLGSATDGTAWLVGPVQRVEGSFVASSRCPSDRTAAVTLLVRNSVSAEWHVAGLARLGRNRAYWVVTAAAFGPPAEYRAVAVVGARPIAPRGRITDLELSRAPVWALSDEIVFRVTAN